MSISGGNMDETQSSQNALKRAKLAFRGRGGLLRMSEAVEAGVHRDTLRAMLDSFAPVENLLLSRSQSNHSKPASTASTSIYGIGM